MGSTCIRLGKTAFILITCIPNLGLTPGQGPNIGFDGRSDGHMRMSGYHYKHDMLKWALLTLDGRF